ncbi:MAG TPA: ATP-binding protein [Alphaproteobacteria bacterium]|nr:ATP-binding protein [Alphaproteobacteria bacterium]
MTPKRHSLVLRLIATGAIWAVVLLIAGGIALTQLYQRSVLGALEDRLQSTVNALVAAAETGDTGEVSLAREPTDPEYNLVFSGRYWQIADWRTDERLRVIARSRSLWDERLRPPDSLLERAAAQPGTPVTSKIVGPDSEPLRIVAQAVILSGRPDMVVISAAEDQRPADREVRRFVVVALSLIFVFSVALLAGLIFQVRIGLAPVFRMRDAVAAVREGQAEKVEGQFPSELRPLGEELNSLIDHSREVVDRARTHVGNLAHALKTPIAVLLNESRNEQGGFAELVTRQAETMSRQVDHHLRRARAAAHAKAVGARTDVCSTLDDLTRTLQRIYGRTGIAISHTCEEGAIFRGERQDLEEMVGNLLDNACKWSGGEVRATVNLIEDGRLEVVVEDDGPGMDAERREQALQRGVRLDESTPGSGLGLSIVADLAQVYGGALSLDASGLGGLLARVTLPARAR